MTTHIKWAGAENSLRELESILDKVSNVTTDVLLKQVSDDWDEDDSETEHHLLEMYGDVAVLNIDGSMVHGSAGWWGRYFGVVGYEDIRNAMVIGVNQGAKAILVNITTPGGMVVGIGELTDFIKEIDKSVPVTFYTGSYAASGGVWLSTTTGKFYASRHAEVGSVGVIAVATEFTEYFKSEGITKRVFKSTPLKASGNPNEKLDAANAAEIQRGVDESSQRFTDHIAMGMGLTSQFVSEAIATGQMWYADEAQRLGLISGITTFDKLLVDLQQKVSQNNNYSSFPKTAEADMSRRKTIKATSPEEALAMAASGIPVVTASDEPVEEPVEQDEPPVEEQVEPVESEADGQETGVADDDAQASAAATPAFSQLLASTTEQLVNAKVELATAKAEAAVLSDKLALMQATETHLKQIVARSVQRAFVAAGSAAPSEESLLAMNAELLIAQSVSAEAMLAKRFGTGGQVSVVLDDEEDEETKKANEAAKYSEEVLTPLSRIFSK